MKNPKRKVAFWVLFCVAIIFLVWTSCLQIAMAVRLFKAAAQTGLSNALENNLVWTYPLELWFGFSLIVVCLALWAPFLGIFLWFAIKAFRTGPDEKSALNLFLAAAESGGLCMIWGPQYLVGLPHGFCAGAMILGVALVIAMGGMLLYRILGKRKEPTEGQTRAMQVSAVISGLLSFALALFASMSILTAL